MANGHLISLSTAIERAQQKNMEVEEIKGPGFLLTKIDTFYCEDRGCIVYGCKEKNICLERDECDFKHACIYNK